MEKNNIMEALTFKPKELLPGVILDRNLGKFEISGISCPMDAYEFYDPIFEWLDEYMKNPLDNTILDLNMTYFNTVSAKFLLRILTKLDSLSDLGHGVRVRWYYEEGDYDMMEEGVEFGDIVSMDFELIPSESQVDDTEDDSYFESILEEF